MEPSKKAPSALICLNARERACGYCCFNRGKSAVSDNLYSVLDLAPEQFQQAYPLIQVLRTNLTLDQWLEYANGLHHRPNNTGGVLSVQCGTKYIYALAAYEIWSRHAESRVMQVEHLCVLDLLNRSVGHLLIEALEQRGQAESCLVIKVSAPEAIGMMSWLRHQMPGAFLQKLGYVIEDNLLSKRLQ
jgi:hypothetical protein